MNLKFYSRFYLCFGIAMALVLLSLPTMAQIKLTGKVTDKDGPMSGVTIQIKGKPTVASITDENGKFQLSVQDNDVLVFKMIGFAVQEIAVNANTVLPLNVRLVEESNTMNEVVVVGYGTQKKTVVSGAVSTVKGDELAKSSSVNLSNALAGRMPGVTATQSSGEPGGDGSNIRIRGINSLNGGNSSPLIVIDGVPSRAGGIERLNPNDIESVSVLKDASAAIYGSRAGNGVILITTKQGKSGKPQFSYDFFYGLQRPTRTPKMANSAEYGEILNELNIFGTDIDPSEWTAAWQGLNTTGSYIRKDNGSKITAKFTPQEMQKFRDGSDPLRYPNTDWFDAVFRDWAPQQRHNVQINGGNEYTRYLVSLGYLDQGAYYKNSATNYQQYDLRLNLESKVSKYITTTLSLVGREEARKFPTVGAGDIFRFIMRGRPNEVAVWPNGLPGPAIEFGYNPVVSTTNLTGYNQDTGDYLQTTGKIEVKIPGVEGLKVTGSASLDKFWARKKNWQVPWTLYSWDKVSLEPDGSPKLSGTVSSPYTDPRLTETTINRLGINLTGMINYDKNFNGHAIALMAAVTRETDKSSGFNAFRRYFLSTLIPELSFGETKEQNIGVNDLFTRARLSYFGRVNYSYKEKYLAEFLWRVDGSYIFPSNKRFGFFPGVSLGWRISEEGFFKDNIKFVDNLKLRGSWGQMGAEAYYGGSLKEFQYFTLLNTGSGVFNDQLVKTLWEGTVPNTDFTWEVANNSNIGLDAYFFKNRLAVTFDYFYNKRSKILTPKIGSIPESAGIPDYIYPPVNIGRVKNSGFEISVNYQDKIGEFSYGIGINGGYAKNKVLFFDEIPGAPDWQRATGKVTGAWLLYQYDGVFKDQAAINANKIDYSSVTGGAPLRPGDMKFKDYNGDGKITADDKVRMDKNSSPTFTGGIALNGQYKGFDLSILIQGAAGGLQMIGLTESGDIGNYLQWSYQNRWSIDKPSDQYPRLSNRNTAYYTDGNKALDNTYWVRSNNYIRLKNVELGYTLRDKWIEKLGLSVVRVYTNGINLVTLDKIKIWDPESTNTSGQYYPQAKVINFGIKATF